jgi:hypothetical protein
MLQNILGYVKYLHQKCKAEEQVPLIQHLIHLMMASWAIACSYIITRRRCVNINISTTLHKDGNEWEHKVRIHNAINRMLQYNIMLNILAAPVSIFGDIKCVLHGTRCDEVFLPVGDKGALCPCQMTDIQGDFLF